MGSGGGIPGLFLAVSLDYSRLVLLDASVKRCEFLNKALLSLDLDRRVDVVCERAEVAARVPSLRNSFSVVVSRSFSQPPITAECAAPFLQKDGILVVSEPPGGNTELRWPKEGCQKVALLPEASIKNQYSFVKLRMTGTCPDEYPRRVGIPAKRPIFQLKTD